ncbi:hypothetical protein [Actinomadura sp. 3N508]|uniref:hypothetical protein n=1 Tax=Actinomadura sp. 3N508 TaxID=3375153 RepID=UPI0037A02A5C
MRTSAGGASPLRQRLRFTSPAGDPLNPDQPTCLFRDLIAEHGLPSSRLLDLLHGAAILALAAGVELKVAQDLLGHSSIVPTIAAYASVLPEVAPLRRILLWSQVSCDTDFMRQKETMAVQLIPAKGRQWSATGTSWLQCGRDPGE